MQLLGLEQYYNMINSRNISMHVSSVLHLYLMHLKKHYSSAPVEVKSLENRILNMIRRTTGEQIKKKC